MAQLLRSTGFQQPLTRLAGWHLALGCAIASIMGCSTLSSAPTSPPPQASKAPTAATGARAKASCETLASDFSYAGLRITSTQRVLAGSLMLPGISQPMPEHCVVQGKLHERKSPVDGKDYAMGFEMRLPTDWNGRFFYQGNGGLDGFITPAFGNILGGAPTSNGLLKGFAVLSSDAGHAFERSNPPIGAALFGVDPQARLDYGYNAVAQLTPMARGLIQHYYGKAADKAYLVGHSNGGRHGMVAAARDLGAYDGVLAGGPGYNLPLAAVAQAWGAQQFATVARQKQPDGLPDLDTSLDARDMAYVAQQVLARCDALDGLTDGVVGDMRGCQSAFEPRRDLKVCDTLQPTAPSLGAAPCLSSQQREVLARVMAGPGVYLGMPWDAGLSGGNWREWKYKFSVGPRDAIALAYVFTTPPSSPNVVSGKGTSIADFAYGFNLERDTAKVHAKTGPYTQSAMEFMTPPDATGMRQFVARGGKMMVMHGGSDPVFSALDTIRWYEGFQQVHGAQASNSVRLFIVPGMNHSGGPSTDQFDMVDALVAWVEQGIAPQQIVARSRGPGSNVPNPEVPADWSPNRTRLLCPWPQVARYRGTGDKESAASFVCSAP